MRVEMIGFAAVTRRSVAGETRRLDVGAEAAAARGDDATVRLQAGPVGPGETYRRPKQPSDVAPRRHPAGPTEHDLHPDGTARRPLAFSARRSTRRRAARAIVERSGGLPATPTAAARTAS